MLELRKKFHELVLDQFAYGGTKYAGDQANPKREATDDLVDDFSYLWLIGTFAKYAKRFKNLARERDLLKVACYMYITWLKRGFHTDTSGSFEIIDTNVEIKSKYFSEFTNISDLDRSQIGGTDIATIYNFFKTVVDKHLNLSVRDVQEAGSKQTVKELIQYGFREISEDDLISIYNTCFNIWADKFKDTAGSDTDTHNEHKAK